MYLSFVPWWPVPVFLPNHKQSHHRLIFPSVAPFAPRRLLSLVSTPQSWYLFPGVLKRKMSNLSIPLCTRLEVAVVYFSLVALHLSKKTWFVLSFVLRPFVLFAWMSLSTHQTRNTSATKIRYPQHGAPRFNCIHINITRSLRLTASPD